MCIGNLGGAPKTHEGRENKDFYSASLAVSVWNGEENETIWYNLTFNDSYKKRIKLCKKATKLYVEGSLKVKTYKNDDGKIQIDRSISVSYMEILAGMKDKDEREEGDGEEEEPREKKSKTKEKTKANEEEDDLPF